MHAEFISLFLCRTCFIPVLGRCFWSQALTWILMNAAFWGCCFFREGSRRCLCVRQVRKRSRAAEERELLLFLLHEVNKSRVWAKEEGGR